MDLRQNIYFASDFHLGVPSYEASLKREKMIVQWLEQIKHDAKEIYLVGDQFDMWFEYRHVVPKYFTRFLGKLAELSDAGITIHAFSGNHDVWMFDYFEKELGIKVYHNPIDRIYAGKKFYIAHGDGLGPGDYGYKFIKRIFRNPFCQWLFKWIHPDWGLPLANFFSGKSRQANYKSDGDFLGEDREWLIIHSKEVLKKQHYDYFIYGHRHHPLDFPLSGGAHCINLGDWITHFTYAVFDGSTVRLEKFVQSEG
jgi:UDP-2,3-diacylglucosamine hydrolase